ncbi:transporter substrate-binding domain-containing diguanylate cyclase [Pelagibaculum spongiae]|uniref:diguanylate cyclase n=1 Tax=Pelagibaculum spongiae TaxID=2080658 RepID=A0A2V1GYH5_9GAMM|nr:diguanylate cyclase [Pelagibaculum spongiae]PVZ70387.1 hypothetical protein DC094_07275 [Pelagibaculum spongiae]
MTRVLLILLLLAGPSLAPAESPKQLAVAFDQNWRPFSYVDQKGQPRGLLVDFWIEWSRINQVNVDFQMLPWHETLQAVKDGRADLHSGLFITSRRDHFLNFADSVTELNGGLFLNRKYASYSETELSGLRIGVIEGGFSSQYVRDYLPKVASVIFESTSEMIRAAGDGKVDGFFSGQVTANYNLQRRNISDQFIYYKETFNRPLYISIAKNNKELHRWVSASMKPVPDAEKRRIYERWVAVERQLPEDFYLWLSFAIVLLVLLLSCGHIYVLRRQVHARTTELNRNLKAREVILNDLRQANRQMEKHRLMLERMSLTDALTGIANRRAFQTSFRRSCYESAALDRPLGLLMIDLDHFKRYNDVCGHQAGDTVLGRVADLLSSGMCRAGDLVCRYGGEEFVCLLPDTDQKGVECVANRLVNLIFNKQIKHPSSEFGVVTISVGGSIVDGNPGNGSALLQLADQQLYEVKRNGRNGVRVAAMKPCEEPQASVVLD